MQSRESSPYYSHQFLFICARGKQFSFEFEEKIYAAYKLKWAKQYQDPNGERLHTLFITGNEKPNAEQFSCLQLADQHSRITIIGHYQVEDDYFSANADGSFRIPAFHFLDIIRYHIKNETVLLRSLADITASDRALRITFVACNVGAKQIRPSMAERMFRYACQHLEKPLRIEMTAPLFYCGPFLCEKNEAVSVFNYFIQGLSTKNIFHKRYAAGLWHAGRFQLFSKGPSLVSLLYPQYRPQNRKIILKIAKDSTLENIKLTILSPEEELLQRPKKN